MKENFKFHVTGLREGNPLANGGFPSQMASNAESISIQWRQDMLLEDNIDQHKWQNSLSVTISS